MGGSPCNHRPRRRRTVWTAKTPTNGSAGISTQWTLILQAHGHAADAATAAQHALMQRYCGVVYRYLLGRCATRPPLKSYFRSSPCGLSGGIFAAQDPERGRFRDYVKTALVHLVTDYHRRRRTEPRPLPDGHPGPQAGHSRPDEPDVQFVASWREELIHQTWQALSQAQPAYHAVLLLHVENPDMPSAEMADKLSVELQKPMTAGNLRVTLHRARERFADLLVEEVARSLQASCREALRGELRDLRLLELCAAALERWRGKSTD